MFYFQVLKLFIPLPMYWALYAQIDSSWTIQSTQLNRVIFGCNIEADQAKAIAPFLLLIFIPIWEQCNIQISPLTSITLGGISAALSFFCAAILQVYIESSTKTKTDQLSVLWQLPQFTLLMLGELWLAMPGLNFSFTQSPPSVRSVMTAAWFCNNAFGNLIVILINELHPFDVSSSDYFLYGSLMFIAILTFFWLANNYQFSNYEHYNNNLNNNEILGERRSSNHSL